MTDYMIVPVSNLLTNGHFYTLNCEGIGNLKENHKLFYSRELAEKKMYSLLRRYSLKIVSEEDDKHEKTYICDRDATFTISRYC